MTAVTEDVSRFVLHEKDGGNALHLMVEGMHCANCAASKGVSL